MSKIKNAWGDGRDVEVLDCACAYRACLGVGENKGSFSQGRGYTHYYAKPALVCMTRHLRGCPHPLSEPDPESARCCDHPRFRAVPAKQPRPSRQRCIHCGQWLRGLRLALCRSLEAT